MIWDRRVFGGGGGGEYVLLNPGILISSERVGYGHPKVRSVIL